MRRYQPYVFISRKADLSVINCYCLHYQSYTGDGFIDLDEFMCVMEEFGVKPEEQLLEAFRVLDVENCGTISANNLKTILRRVFEDQRTDTSVESIVHDIDLNGDSRIDYDSKICTQALIYAYVC